MLSVESEKDLYKYLHRFESRGLKVTKFHEPDINDELTAITVEPTDKARKLCSNLPLALKECKKDF